MFTLVAATLFSGAFLFALGVMGGMFALYHDKMAAALQFQPIPRETPVYRLSIRRPRLMQDGCGRASRPMHSAAIIA